MKYNIGDKVRFLNDVGGGVISKTINASTVMVKTSDGFEIPTLISELVVVDSTKEQGMAESKTINEKAPETPKPAGSRNKDMDKLVGESAPVFENIPLLAVITQKSGGNTLLQFNLLNDSEQDIVFVASLQQNGQQSLFEKGSVEAGVKYLLGEVDNDDAQMYDALVIQYIEYKEEGLFEINEPKTFTFPLAGVNFRQGKFYRNNEYFDHPALIVPMTDNRHSKKSYLADNKTIEKVKSEKDQIRKPEAKPKMEVELEEVDLHITEIMDNYQHLEPGEIIEVQLARFKTALDGAINDGKTKKIVFIHGVGNGKLKYELRKQLDEKYSRYAYQDASFAEYGYGATMVILKR
jgi:hypothetical protein